jgi:protein-tyrosine phosphatase
MAQPWFGWIRNAVDRRRHARRRSVAMEELRRWTFRSVLFVCHANLCRSPFAAAAFRAALPASLRRKLKVASLGFIGPGRAPPGRALDAASRRGIDLSSHRSALLNGDAVRASDLVVVMSPEQATAVRANFARDSLVVVLGDLDPLPIESRTIRDPWGADDSTYEASYARIERCVRVLADAVAKSEEAA